MVLVIHNFHHQNKMQFQYMHAKVESTLINFGYALGQ